MAVSIKIDNVVKTFGQVKALSGISLDVKPGELFFLLGPSGCGKTTLLRHIAGFCTPDSGTISIDGEDITALPPYKRDAGMVFQSYALWPHMTVAENVAFGLKMRRTSANELHTRVYSALEMVKMTDKANSKPNELSGGQQQRVALARALVVKPRCLLLDEPLSNLDAKLRQEMRVEIRRICKNAGLTAIYVTHDQKEALSMADRLAVMRNGAVEQIGTPSEVYRHPVNAFTASFVGETNFLPPEFFGGAYVPSVGTKMLSVRPETIHTDRRSDSDIPVNGKMYETIYLGETAQHLFDAECGTGEVFQVRIMQLNPEIIARENKVQTTVFVTPSDIVPLSE